MYLTDNTNMLCYNIFIIYIYVELEVAPSSIWNSSSEISEDLSQHLRLQCKDFVSG
jgi:hypothetical protein